MADYAPFVSTKVTSPTSPVRGMNQVQNEEGGYVFPVTWQTRLRRFLILGHEGGCYYASEKKRVIETVDCIDEGLRSDFRATVDLIVEVSLGGLAAKNDHAIFALAYIAGHHSGTYMACYALSKLNQVCRIGTHLFAFCSDVQHFRGWGRSLRQAVAGWYTDRQPLALARQVTKYKQRNGWSHRDVLRKAHPQATGMTQEVLQYVTQPGEWASYPGEDPDGDVTQYLTAVEEAKTASKKSLLELIDDYGLVREHIPTEMLNDIDIWAALLEKMPLHAMVRNLGKMSSIGLLRPLGEHNRKVVQALGGAESIRQARLHPLSILIAQRQYARGRGDRGSLTWAPVPQIIDALEDAFYLGFDAVEPTGKNLLLAVDVSGSMSWAQCAGAPITCCEGAAVMAMVAAKTEPNTHIVGFCDTVKDLGITAKDTLHSACQKAQVMNFGGTDCGAAMAWAMAHKIDVDCFCVYTDSQTWAGDMQPWQALRAYRQQVGRPAKLAALQMEAGSMSIANPSDAGMMDFCGFDTSVPPILADFIQQ